MKPTDRVLHHTMAGCTDPQRAGIIVNEIDGGYAVKWRISYPSGFETTHTEWYEPSELIHFVEAVPELDRQREFNWSHDNVIEKEAKGA